MSRIVSVNHLLPSASPAVSNATENQGSCEIFSTALDVSKGIPYISMYRAGDSWMFASSRITTPPDGRCVYHTYITHTCRYHTYTTHTECVT
mmetsp:Transcript_22101/g.35494  ORF Transcript_22101/g.35494 Transcript_22101/m.35494 type:complete len:92 (-) Transcript_22101:1567-1842(-)